MQAANIHEPTYNIKNFVTKPQTETSNNSRTLTNDTKIFFLHQLFKVESTSRQRTTTAQTGGESTTAAAGLKVLGLEGHGTAPRPNDGGGSGPDRGKELRGRRWRGDPDQAAAL